MNDFNDSKFDQLDSRVRTLEVARADQARALEERKEALHVALRALESRLALLNELRVDVLSKAAFDIVHAQLVERVENVEKMQGRIYTAALVIVALVGIIGTLLHLLKP